MSNQPDPDPGVETPPPHPPDPPSPTVAAPPPAPPTIAPFPAGATPPPAPDALGTTSPPVIPATQPPKGSGGRTLPWVLAAVLAAAAIGLGIWAFSLKGELDDRDDAIEELRADSDELDSQLSAIQEGQEAMQAELDDATATVDSLTTELETAQSDLATAQSDLAATQGELDEATAKVADLEAQLEAATSTTTTTTTLPPDTAPPADPQEDGVISAEEFTLITQALGSTVPAGFTIEQAQDIANQACAATDADSLTNVVLNIQATYVPDATLFDAGTLTGGVASQACYSHIQALAGA